MKIISIILLFLFSFCTKKQQISYASLEEYSNDVIIGVGYGRNYEDAKKAALSDIVGSVSSTINNTIEDSSQYNSSGFYNASAYQKTIIESEKITLNNHKIIYQNQNDENFIIKISVEKKNIINQMHLKIQDNIKLLKSFLTEDQNLLNKEIKQDLLKININYIYSLKLINEIKKYININISLGDDKKYIEELNYISSAEHQIKNTIEKIFFYVDCENLALKTNIELRLNESNFKIIQKSKEDDKYILRLKCLDPKIIESRIFNSYIAKINQTIHIIKTQNEYSFSIEGEAKSSSVLSIQDAIEGAYIKISKNIVEKIISILNSKD